MKTTKGQRTKAIAKKEAQKGQQILRSAYAKKFGLPVAAIAALQRLKVIPVTLVDVGLIAAADDYFLVNYRKTWGPEDSIKAGLALKTLGERELFLISAQDARPEWHKWLDGKYEELYMRKLALPAGQTATKDDFPPGKELKKEILARFGIVVSAVTVSDLRKVAKKRTLKKLALRKQAEWDLDQEVCDESN